jgi:MFS family permease
VSSRWVHDAYTPVFGCLLLLGACAGDLLGRRRALVFGLVVFSIASLLPLPFCLRIFAARAKQENRDGGACTGGRAGPLNCLKAWVLCSTQPQKGVIMGPPTIAHI